MKDLQARLHEMVERHYQYLSPERRAELLARLLADFTAPPQKLPPMKAETLQAIEYMAAE